ncbi:MAG: 3'-5' exonuclease [Egibacteraceae bacterium]
MVGEADRVVVVDTETTGVYPSDRVVEIAAVTLDVWGNVIDRWETLVNPKRDVGATCIHGITNEMLVHAPAFEDIAGALATRLHGAAIAAHNLPFDRRMLMAEFGRIGLAAELGTGLDTLRVTGGKLSVVCAQYGIPLSNAHCALHDALATAQLLIFVASRTQGSTRPAQMPSGLVSIARVVRRSDLVGPMVIKVPDPPFLAQLAVQLDHATETDPAIVAYLDVLDRALADLHLEPEEKRQLAVIGAQHGLTMQQIAATHRRYVNELIDAAFEDHLVTADEYEQLARIARA